MLRWPTSRAPPVRTRLHASGGELELIVSGYTLAYAVLLVTSARLGETRGYRQMFLAGLSIRRQKPTAHSR